VVLVPVHLNEVRPRYPDDEYVHLFVDVLADALPAGNLTKSPGAQHSAMEGKPGKRKQLRYAGFATACNARQHPFAHA